MAEIELQGVDAIIDKLNSINANISKLTNEALQKAAEPVLEDAKSNAPVRTGNLRNSIKKSNVKGTGEKYILVESDVYYSRFQEFGTSHQSAKPFLAPAFEKNKTEINNIIAETLKEGLK